MNQPSPVGDTPSPSRPFLVKLLAAIFLLLSILGWVRMEQAIQNAAFIDQYASAGLPIFLGLSGLVWGLVGLPAVWGLWQGRGWVMRATWIAAAVYPTLYWLNWLFAVQAPESRENWPFIAGLCIAWFLLVWWVLTRRGTKIFIDRKTGTKGKI